MHRPVALTTTARRLRDGTAALAFAPPVTHVYHPLDYAWPAHRRYLAEYGTGRKEVLLVGMNPGPFGMAQTGVPFGDVAMVRDWLGIVAAVGKPDPEHPKRPVLGFECPRGEVSGRRLWGWAKERFGTPERFFARFFVWNYCPLSFMEGSGRNRTPDKLPAEERDPLFAACDAALAEVVRALDPRYVIGVGRFAATRVERALPPGHGRTSGVAPHPSPASPIANQGWAAPFEASLVQLGIQLG